MVMMGNSMYGQQYNQYGQSNQNITSQTYSTQTQNTSSYQQSSSAVSGTANQMALMANNMALTGQMLMQFASLLQMFCQSLMGSSSSSTSSTSSTSQQSGNCGCPSTGTPSASPSPSGGYTQPPSYSNPPVYYPPYMAPTPAPVPAPTPAPVPAPAPTPSYNGGNGARYWGDPHLEGFDGEKYDVMGKGGNIYNMLSDKGIQYNTKFVDWGSPGADGVQPTVIGEAGIQVGDNLVYFDRSGSAPTVNGKPLTKDQKVELGDGRYASWDGNQLEVNTGEYTIDLVIKDKEKNNGYLDSAVKINEGVNPLADGVAAHGLLGQTADGVKGERKGGDNNQNIEKQGGSVIDGVVDDYKVNTLWDNNFKYNRFEPISANNDSQDALQQLLSLLSGLKSDLAA